MVQSSLLASGSVNGFLEGKHFNRCKRIHPLVAVGLEILHFKSFLELNNVVITDQVTEEIERLRTSSVSSFNIENVDLNDLLNNYNIYKQQTVDDGECQKAWSCLRNNYRKALKNRVNKSEKMRPIKFEKDWNFCKSFFQDRPQLSNLDSSSEDTQLSEDTQPHETEIVSQMSFSSHATDSRPAKHVSQRSYMSSENQKK
ncbi:unnamed protein product [Colias eurytheme]|nr:unnamed protein product [Colias eurytheme]